MKSLDGHEHSDNDGDDSVDDNNDGCDDEQGFEFENNNDNYEDDNEEHNEYYCVDDIERKIIKMMRTMVTTNGQSAFDLHKVYNGH